MKKTFLLLLCLFTASIACAADISGTWASNKFDEEQLWVSLNHERKSNFGMSIPLASLKGLTRAALTATATTSAAFTLSEEAGSVQFEGSFRNGRGSGVFDFAPNRDFFEKLKTLGVRMSEKVGDKELLLFTTTQFSTQTIRELQALGYRDLDLDEVEAIALFHVTAAFAREMRGAGLGELSLDDLVAFRIHGVSTEFIREMTAIGFPKPDKDEVVAWRIHGVTPAWVKEIRALGFQNASAEDLSQAKLFNVTPELIRELRSLGYDGLSLDDLVAMKIHGVTPQYIRDLRAAGYEDVPAEKLVDMKIHGIESRKLRKRE